MKTIFITGTSSGLGNAAVRLFHSRGWKVIATMRNIEGGNIFRDLEGVEMLELDITNPEQIKTAVTKAITFGDVDVVLNNAAYGAIGPLESVSEEQLIKQIDTNLLGAIRVTQAFVPHFRERKNGLFINITSVAGLVTFPFDSLYHAVKWGLHGWSEGLSYELSHFGIGVKTVAPGYIRTQFAANVVITSTEPYQELLDKYLTVVQSMTDPQKSGSTAGEVAEIIYEAATDGKDQVHYIAGDDCRGMYERRSEIGPEAFRKEMSAVFLG